MQPLGPHWGNPDLGTSLATIERHTNLVRQVSYGAESLNDAMYGYSPYWISLMKQQIDSVSKHSA